MDKNTSVTKEDLQNLESRQKIEFLDLLRTQVAEAREEILRTFGNSQTANIIRIRKLEADHAVLDTSSSTRLANLEDYVREIEKKQLLGE